LFYIINYCKREAPFYPFYKGYVHEQLPCNVTKFRGCI
jgi:hypothetical protein